MGTDRARLFNKEIADSIVATRPDALGKFLDESLEGLTISELKSTLVQNLAFSDDEILLDYWGCYAHVFAGHPDGSISSLDYLPEQQEEVFLLLRSEHVEQMIRSLREHVDDLTVMDEQQIAKLEQWRDQCRTDHKFFVAYEFDF